LIRENIVFPKDAADYAKNLFVHSLSSDKEVSTIIKETGPNFFNIARECVQEHWGDWSKIMKDIGEKSGNKGKELFMPIRAAITCQLSGPELDQVTKLLDIDRVVRRLEEASQL
jgi:glutamyl-tRNA synthetase